MAIRKNAKGTQFTALYHGSNQRFEKGDVILPAALTGATPSTVSEDYSVDDYKKDRIPSTITPNATVSDYELAHASENAAVAASYAQRARDRLGGGFHVYRVAPVNDQDVEHMVEDEYASPSGFRVIRRLPIDDLWDSRLDTQQEYLDKYYKRHFGTSA